MTSQLNRDLEKSEANKTTLFDLIFRTREGKIVIGQMPNLPVLVGLFSTLLLFILPGSKIQTVVALVAFGTLFTWAWQEIFEGVNYFRRALGLISLVGLIVLGLTLSY